MRFFFFGVKRGCEINVVTFSTFAERREGNLVKPFCSFM